MNTTSQYTLLNHGMRALRTLAGLCVFSLLYASCGPATLPNGERAEDQGDIKDVESIVAGGAASQASALSQGGLSGVGQVCAPYH